MNPLLHTYFRCMKSEKLRMLYRGMLLLCFSLSYLQLMAASYKDMMQLGTQIVAPTPQPEKYFNDLIHPCVRYSPEGVGGHKWWLVATPYRGFNAGIENPILYYGDSPDGSTPPLTWNATAIVEDTPKNGYNSDPALFFENNKMWVFWRENGTQDCYNNKYKRAIFGRTTTDGIYFSAKKVFAGETSDTVDHEMCPIFSSIHDSIKMFGCFHNITKKNRVPYGMSVWGLDNNDFTKMFLNQFDVKPVYKSGFDFWHFDLFQYKDKYYCVVSPESANEILLGESLDGYNYVLWDRPLLSTKNTGRTYFYKPSAVVYNDILYLWYPLAELNSNPQTNRLWMSSMNFDEILTKIKSTDFSTDFTNSDDLMVDIKVLNGEVIVDSKLPSSTLIVYNESGQLIQSTIISTGISRLNLRKGIYMVKVDNHVTKIIV
jgi:hypothetical protein